MKIHLRKLTVSLLCFAMLLCFISCSGDAAVDESARYADENLQSIELNTESESKESVYGSEPDLSGLVIKANYNGGYNRTVSYSANESDFTITLDNTNAGTDRIITVSYKGKSLQIDGWTVQPKVAGLSWSKTPLTYNGEPQSPAATATGLVGSDVCAVTVTVEGSHTTAGTYTAVASQLGNSNYKLPDITEHEYRINKAKVTVTPPVGRTVSYSGQPQQLITPGSLSIAEAGVMRYYFAGSSELHEAEEITATADGSYSVYYICENTDTGNYEYTSTSGGPVQASIATVFQTDSEGLITRSLDDDYYKNTVFESITILSSGATEIGEMLLADVNVKHVVIEDGLKKIGDVAFASCDQLESITLPDSIEQIFVGAFAYCTSLKEVILPAYLTKIEEYAFYSCRSLKEIIIPAGVATIEDYAFSDCTSLTSIKFAGTKAQWDEIDKGSNIFAGCPTTTVIFLGGDA